MRLPGAVFRSRTVPSTASFGGARQGPPPDELADVPQKRDVRLLLRRDLWAAMTEMLGVVVENATDLQGVGQARGRDGRVLRWSYWAPARRVLVDRFRRRWPAEAELEDRAAFARENGIAYAVVGPGQAMAPRDVRNWLAQLEAQAERGN